MSSSLSPLTPSQAARRLADVTLFRGLSDEQRRTVVDRASLVEMPLGGRIFTEGELTTQLYVLLSGEATLSVRLGSDEEQAEIATVYAGELLGETGPLLGEPRSATAQATRPCHLLRLTAETFHALLNEMPALALALGVELARRIETMRREQADWVAEHGPGAHAIERPEITQKGAYMRRYYSAAIRGVLRRHQLIATGSFPRYEDSFTFTPAEQARWFSLFGVRETDAAIPFTYFTTSATLALMQIVADVGVNFRHLLHLRSEMQLNPEGRVLTPGEAYRCSYQLRDIVRLRTDRVALVVQSEVHDEAGRPMVAEKDFFIIKNLPEESVAALEKSRTLGHHDASELLGSGKRSAGLAQRHAAGDTAVRRVDIPVRADMGVAYGQVSGDMNVVHTSSTAARLFGYRRPFIQGLCTANYILKSLTEASGHAPSRLTIGFGRPVVTDSVVALYHTADAFEVCDAKGSILASGEWEKSSPVRARRSMAFSAMPDVFDLPSTGDQGMQLQ